MAEIRWTENAINDIENIANFIALNSERYAKIQVQRFFERTTILEHSPKAGRKVPELNNLTTRELIIGNYRIIYEIIDEKQIDILSVHNSNRLLKNNPNLNE